MAPLDYSAQLDPHVLTSGGREVKSQLGKEDFLQLLVAQMRFQDPLKPLEGKEFVAQLAQFSALEQMLNVSLAANLTYGMGMLGKTVYGTDAAGLVVAGEALSVRVVEGKPLVNVKLGDGSLVELELGKVFQVDAQ